MVKLLKPEIAVYDCPDAIVFENSSRKQRLYDQFKKRVLQESTVSLFTSKALLDDGARYAENHYYVPNGVDVQGFIQKRYKTPEIVKDISGIILGVVGTFDERVDIELLEFILENIEEAILLLVGPIQTSIGKLGKHPRVLRVGKRRYEEIPSFIKRFDVALIPYRINEVTKAVYPVKLHEYLILGKPVVATDLPELEQFSDIIRIANTKEKYLHLVRLAIREKDKEIRQKRIKVAKENSWEQRTSQITEILQNYL
jgi:glycosyltransferase involved in cell wall biosynthesis